MIMPKIKILRQEQTPIKAYDGDAGWDVFADKDYLLWSQTWRKIPLGFCLELDDGWFAMIAERSGMAAKQGAFTIGNIIDSTYRGEVHAIIFNGQGTDRLQIAKGDKIAQMLIIPCYTSTYLRSVQELSPSIRGEGGFGSTGK